MHVTRVRSNLKGEFEHALGPCTLLTGLNGAGKSRVIDALSLALTGAARTPGLGKLETTLMALKPAGVDGLFTEVALSDGSLIGWASSGSTAKAKKATWASSVGAELPVGHLVAEEAAGLLLADQKRLRAALVAHLDIALPASVFKSRAAPTIFARLETLLGGASQAYGIEAVLGALSAVDDQLRATRKALKQVQSECSVAGAAVALSQEETEEMARLLALSTAPGLTPEDRAELERFQASLVSEQTSTRAAMKTLDAEMARDGQSLADEARERLAQSATELLEAFRSYVAMTGREGPVRCPCCGTPGIEPSALAAQHAKWQQAYDTVIAAQRATLERQGQRDQATMRLDGLAKQLAKVTSQLASAKEKDSIDKTRLSELQDRHEQAERASKLAAERVRLAQAELELKAVRELLQDVVATTLDKQTTALAERINAVMPDHLRVTIALRDGAREVCRLEVNGTDFRALSGAERAALIAAFTAVSTPRDAPPVRLLVIDDVWVDRVKTPALLASLQALVASETGPSQAVVCLVQYDGEVPDGWTRIDLSDESDEEEAGHVF